jgi:hypothetical protein
VCGLRGEIAHAHLHPYHGWPQDDPIEIKRHERPIPRKLAARKRSRCIALDPYGRNVDDPAHGSPHAGREQSRGSLGMHAFCPIPGTVLKHARAVHHCINASEMRQPVRRIDRVRSIDADVRHGHQPRLGRAAARANYRVAERRKPRGDCRPDQPGDPDPSTRNVSLTRCHIAPRFAPLCGDRCDGVYPYAVERPRTTSRLTRPAKAAGSSGTSPSRILA